MLWHSVQSNLAGRMLHHKSVMADLQDFGITYWGYDSNGSLKYDVGIRPGKGNEPSSLDFYSDVIGKMTGVEGNKGNVLRFYLFFDGRSAPTFDAHVNSRDSVIGLSDEVWIAPAEAH